MLVSHINANTEKGIDWLNSIVVKGLRNGGGNFSEWEIEVHGNDGDEGEEEEFEDGGEEYVSDGDNAGGVNNGEATTNDNEADEADDESATENDGNENGHASSLPPESPGPAVYIIHNLSKTRDRDRRKDAAVDPPPTVPLKFFSY